MNLVFIHGRSQAKKDPAKLQSEWEQAWKNGLDAAGLPWPQNVKVHFPFYGNELDRLLKQLSAPLVEDVKLRGATPDSEETQFRGELLQEMASGNGISDVEIQENFTGLPNEKGPLNWEWVHSILKAFDRTPFRSSAIDFFTRDVYVYLTKPPIRRAINKIVSDKIPSEPCVVVGHSLGSIVGYNVLIDRIQSSRICQYITVGSPLGIKAIKQRLTKPLKMPQKVNGWFNALDEGDVVALYPLNTEHFNIDPAIVNKTDVNNHTDNQHGIIGYLDDKVVAKVIYDSLLAAG